MGHDVRGSGRELGMEASLVVPALGFGSFLFVADNVNAPMLMVGGTGIVEGSRALADAVSIALTALLLLALGRREPSRGRAGALPLACAVLVSAAYGLEFFMPAALQSSAVLTVLVNAVSFICRAVFFYFWARCLLPLGSRRLALVFGLSLCFFAAVSMLSLLQKEGVAKVFLTVLPCVSAVCLRFSRVGRGGEPGGQSPQRDEIFLQAQECLDGRGARRMFGVSVLLPAFCGSLVLAVFYQIWTQMPGASTQPLAAQAGLVLGALAMAAVTFGLVARFWTYLNLQAVAIFVPLLVAMMLWLSLSEPAWVTLYFAFMLVAQKGLFVLGLTAPYMFRLPGGWMTPWCVTYIVFQLGGFVGSSLLGALPEEAMKAVLTLCVAAMALGALLTFLVHGLKVTEANAGYASGSFRNEGRYRRAVRKIADAYALTAREQDILVELGRGRNAQYVAERLVTSPQTVKTHQKSIYSKLDLHSQQELIALVDKTIMEDEGA